MKFHDSMKLNPSSVLKHLYVISCLLGFGFSTAQAATVYPDFTSFQAQTSTLNTITFEDLLGTPGFPANYAGGTGFFTSSSSGMTIQGVQLIGENGPSWGFDDSYLIGTSGPFL